MFFLLALFGLFPPGVRRGRFPSQGWFGTKESPGPLWATGERQNRDRPAARTAWENIYLKTKNTNWKLIWRRKDRTAGCSFQAERDKAGMAAGTRGHLRPQGTEHGAEVMPSRNSCPLFLWPGRIVRTTAFPRRASSPSWRIGASCPGCH